MKKKKIVTASNSNLLQYQNKVNEYKQLLSEQEEIMEAYDEYITELEAKVIKAQSMGSGGGIDG